MTVSSRIVPLVSGSALAASLVALFVLAPACTVTVGDGTYDGGPSIAPRPTPDAAPRPGNTDPCSVCLFSQCSASHARCDVDANCIGIYNCAIQPGCDKACVTACYTSRPAEARASYDALALCDRREACTTCASQCAGNPVQLRCEEFPPPVAPDASVPDAAPAPRTCAQCAAQSCTAETAACGPDTTCAKYSQCVAGCKTGPSTDLTECLGICEQLYEAGKKAEQALVACTGTSCTAECR